MKKFWSGLLVLLGILVLAAAAFAYHKSKENNEPEEELQFTAMEASNLPLIYMELAGQQSNVLHGYTQERDLSMTELPLIPITKAKLALKVSLYGNTLEGVTYRIREKGTDTVIGSGEFADWENDSDVVSISVGLGDLIPEGKEYLLDLGVSLGNGKQIWYYARICDGESTKAAEMMTYVMDFHNDLYEWDSAKTHESNLESVAGYDDKTLAVVDIHSSIRQLNWGTLYPEEVPGTLTAKVLELDGKFGSINLEYEVKTESDVYLVSEFFCVRNGIQKIYLMNYRRTMEEVFSGKDERFADGAIDFGIVTEDQVELMQSEDESCIAFTVADEVWNYHPLTEQLIQAFTFRDPDDQARSGYRRHGVKLLQVDNNGDVHFLVYGYMNRGAHEGEVGISCMTYQESGNSLKENFFLPFDGSLEDLEEGVDTLACMGEGGKVFLMAGDTVYSVDEGSHQITVLAEHAKESRLVANREHTAVAWELQGGSGVSTSVQILYVDTGESQVVEAKNGDWISPEGFIEDDCILTTGHTGDETEQNGELIYPAYALIIQNREGREETRYEYSGIYISRVNVRDDQIEMSRLTGDGNGTFTETSSDTLMQSSGGSSEGILTLTPVITDTQKRVYRLQGVGDPKNPADVRCRTPKGISYEPSRAFELSSVKVQGGEALYYAYAEGEFRGTYTVLGEAVDQVFDTMGVVLDSSGQVLWRRTDRADKVSLALTDTLTGTGIEGRNSCLMMMAQMAGQTGFLVQIPEGATAMEAMDTLMPGKALNLTGAPVKALMYYLNLGQPILVVDRENNALLMIGYDLYNVQFYDPAQGTKILMGQEDTAKYLADGCSCVGYFAD